MSDVPAPHHDIKIAGERENVTAVIDGERIPVRYVDGHYIALLHSPYVAHRSAQELADYVGRAVIDMRRP